MLLQQDRGMIDERDTEGVALDGPGRDGGHNIVQKCRRSLRAAGELPAYDVEKSTRLRRGWIEEALAIEMFRIRQNLYLCTAFTSCSSGQNHDCDMLRSKLGDAPPEL